VTTRASRDLDAPATPRPVEEQSSPRLRRFPIVIPADVVFEMARQQREISVAKAVARHSRRSRR
jgi:hypothetical protein